jgi:16S rRNA (cytosine967-C5)-methyltransferase
LNTRAKAAQLIAPVIRGKSSLEIPKDLPDAALCAELCYGTLRWLPRLQCILSFLVSKPLREKDADIQALLLIGIYQIDFMRVADHAAVTETVRSARKLGKPWAAKLVNGVLRNYLRAKDETEAKLSQAAEFRFAHPAWMIDSFNEHWPDKLRQITDANNQRPPMTLRVNLNKISRQEYLELLAQSGASATTGNLSAAALTLEYPMPIENLPGFGEGLVSIQDEAAQLCAPLLALQPGQYILDACSAPGGKTCHILETQEKVNLDAVDIDSKRLHKVAENLQRLGLEANLQEIDAGDPNCWKEPKYDRILLDAPCSGTGVIRRHPDIKCLRRKSDLDQFAQQQLRLLDSVWQALTPNGLLLYVTCSIMPQENSELVETFLRSQPQARAENLQVDWGLPSGPGRQLLPDPAGTDGFYFALLRKQTGQAES